MTKNNPLDKITDLSDIEKSEKYKSAVRKTHIITLDDVDDLPISVYKSKNQKGYIEVEHPSIKFVEEEDRESTIEIDWDGSDFGVGVFDTTSQLEEASYYILSKSQAKAIVTFITDQLEKGEETL